MSFNNNVMKDIPKISVVIPLFNEENNIRQLYDELIPVLTKLVNNYEIIFVDDGSRDGSFEIVKQFSLENKSIKGISLSRNFGHQIALTAGLHQAKGETVITMDADLQHPPNLIPELYKLYKNGYDIVNTIRLDTADAGIFKKFTSNIFYKLLNYLSDIKIEPASADFRLMSRKAVDAFISINEKDRFTRGLVSWMGFKQVSLDYFAPPRFAGKSKYTIRRMFSFGLDGITSFSSKPLRISFYFGISVFVFGIIYAIFAIINYFHGMVIPGWTSNLVSILLIGGIQLVSIGIIGEYIARIFNEVKARPLYFIKDKVERIDN